jgi:hypothetical protein
LTTYTRDRGFISALGVDVYMCNLANNTAPGGGGGGGKTTIVISNYNLRRCQVRTRERAGLDQFLIYEHIFYLPLFNRVAKNVLR